MGDTYVCSKARLQCSCGNKIADLIVMPERTVLLKGEPQANIGDLVSMRNVMPFGRCRSMAYPPTGSATAANHGTLTPMPCVPGTLYPWMEGKMDVLVMNQPALLKSSTLKCIYGGTISIVFDGQKGSDSFNMEFVAKAEQDEVVEQQKLSPEQILDGIQLALDVAGFIPGFGAIADLTNAAISACRGDWAGAGLSLIAAVPGIGDAAAGAKMARKGVKMARAAKL